MSFLDAEKTDIRRHCGYPAYGNAADGNMGWRFYQQYGALEYRMNNLSAPEEAVVRAQLFSLSALESGVPAAAANLDTDAASVWKRNPDEPWHRIRLYNHQRRQLCAFFGIAPGPAIDGCMATLEV